MDIQKNLNSSKKSSAKNVDSFKKRISQKYNSDEIESDTTQPLIDRIRGQDLTKAMIDCIFILGINLI